MASPTDKMEVPEESSGKALSTGEPLALIQAVEVLFQKWNLTDFEKRTLLGIENDERVDAWRADNVSAVSQETLIRLDDFLRIHRALRVIFRDLSQCYSWVKRPNDAFFGKSALEIMILNGGPGVVRIRAYLEAEVDG